MAYIYTYTIHIYTHRYMYIWKTSNNSGPITQNLDRQELFSYYTFNRQREMTARALSDKPQVCLAASIIQPVSLVCYVSVSVHQALRFRRLTLSNARSSVISRYSIYWGRRVCTNLLRKYYFSTTKVNHTCLHSHSNNQNCKATRTFPSLRFSRVFNWGWAVHMCIKVDSEGMEWAPGVVSLPDFLVWIFSLPDVSGKGTFPKALMMYADICVGAYFSGWWGPYYTNVP
jgi:hypothetical protein